MAPEPEGLDWRQDEYDGIPPRYMAVTADKYELPVTVFDNIQDLSRWAHIPREVPGGLGQRAVRPLGVLVHPGVHNGH